MGEVYLALANGPVGFQQLQVLKFLRDDLDPAVRDDVRRMFADEARLAAQLNHPNIVRCHEVQFDGERPYLAMEFLDGQSLLAIQRRTLGDHREFSLAMRVLVLCQVLEALHYAHELSDYHGVPLKVVHRDVSPDNVFVTYAGQVKLMDFGIAKTLHSYRTMTGVIKGKVGYMAPEQVLGDAVDARTDVYAVGVMLWEAIAAAPMHAPNQSPLQIMDRVRDGRLPALDSVALDVDAELVEIVTRAIQREPSARYQSAYAVLDALSAWLEGQPRMVPREIGGWVRQTFAREAEVLKTMVQRGLERQAAEQTPAGVYRGSPTRKTAVIADEQLGIYAATRPVPLGPNSLTDDGSRKQFRRVGWGIGALVLATIATSTIVSTQGDVLPVPQANEISAPPPLTVDALGGAGAHQDNTSHEAPALESTPDAAVAPVLSPSDRTAVVGDAAVRRPPSKRPDVRRSPPSQEQTNPDSRKASVDNSDQRTALRDDSSQSSASPRPDPGTESESMVFPVLSPLGGLEVESTGRVRSERTTQADGHSPSRGRYGRE